MLLLLFVERLMDAPAPSILLKTVHCQPKLWDAPGMAGSYEVDRVSFMITKFAGCGGGGLCGRFSSSI